jgi:glycerol-3-phosphate dehydrogenase
MARRRSTTSRARSLLRRSGRVCGATLHDCDDGGNARCAHGVVVDATGAWSGALHGKGPRLRPLRGSHLCCPHGACRWRRP